MGLTFVEFGYGASTLPRYNAATLYSTCKPEHRRTVDSPESDPNQTTYPNSVAAEVDGVERKRPMKQNIKQQDDPVDNHEKTTKRALFDIR